jgi:hypothetical protein
MNESVVWLVFVILTTILFITGWYAVAVNNDLDSAKTNLEHQRKMRRFAENEQERLQELAVSLEKQVADNKAKYEKQTNNVIKLKTAINEYRDPIFKMPSNELREAAGYSPVPWTQDSINPLEPLDELLIRLIGAWRDAKTSLPGKDKPVIGKI